jgi:hypothetical protein
MVGGQYAKVILICRHVEYLREAGRGRNTGRIPHLFVDKDQELRSGKYTLWDHSFRAAAQASGGQ